MCIDRVLRGGGVSCALAAAGVFGGCVRAQYGGAIYVYGGGSIEVADSSFASNTATEGVRASRAANAYAHVSFLGGRRVHARRGVKDERERESVPAALPYAEPSLPPAGCLFARSAFRLGAQGAINLLSSSATIGSSSFTDNNGNKGGAMYLSSSSATVESSSFTGNNASTSVRPTRSRYP